MLSNISGARIWKRFDGVFFGSVIRGFARFLFFPPPLFLYNPFGSGTESFPLRLLHDQEYPHLDLQYDHHKPPFIVCDLLVITRAAPSPHFQPPAVHNDSIPSRSCSVFSSRASALARSSGPSPCSPPSTPYRIRSPHPSLTPPARPDSRADRPHSLGAYNA